MKTSRLEAFSDGVMAIIITIMVLELDAPEHTSFTSLLKITPIFVSYLVSFIYVGIYWNNHHHLFQASKKVNGKVLWANLHLLFWLSLILFAIAWVGENHLASSPVMLYGFVLLMSGLAFNILVSTLMHSHDDDFSLKEILGNRKKKDFNSYLFTWNNILLFLSYSWNFMLCFCSNTMDCSKQRD